MTARPCRVPPHLTKSREEKPQSGNLVSFKLYLWRLCYLSGASVRCSAVFEGLGGWLYVRGRRGRGSVLSTIIQSDGDKWFATNWQIVIIHPEEFIATYEGCHHHNLQNLCDDQVIPWPVGELHNERLKNKRVHPGCLPWCPLGQVVANSN